MKTEIPKTDIIQWAADTSRLLKVALRSHDPEMVSSLAKKESLRDWDLNLPKRLSAI